MITACLDVFDQCWDIESDGIADYLSSGLWLFQCSAVAVNFVKVGLIETQRVF